MDDWYTERTEVVINIYTKWECRITAEVFSCTQWLYRSQNIQQSRHNNKITTNLCTCIQDFIYMYTSFVYCKPAVHFCVQMTCGLWFVKDVRIVHWLSCDCRVIVVWLSGYKTNVMSVWNRVRLSVHVAQMVVLCVHAWKVNWKSCWQQHMRRQHWRWCSRCKRVRWVLFLMSSSAHFRASLSWLGHCSPSSSFLFLFSSCSLEGFLSGSTRGHL